MRNVDSAERLAFFGSVVHGCTDSRWCGKMVGAFFSPNPGVRSWVGGWKMWKMNKYAAVYARNGFYLSTRTEFHHGLSYHGG